MSSSDEIVRADLNNRLKRLELTVRRMRRRVAALAAACVILVFLVITLFRQRGESRDYYNGKIHDLVCSVAALAPPGQSVITDRLRRNYKCPAYRKPHRETRHHPRAADRG